MPLRPYEFEEVRVRSRGYLPHWELDDSHYSINFRLADSLPQTVLGELTAALTRVRAAISGGRVPTLREREEISRRSGLELDKYLDRGFGSCHLRDERIARIVADALQFFNGSRYVLNAWCVMPNHVHVVLYLANGEDLSKILHSWKSFTARKVNALVDLRGAFWQREYYDRLIRDEAELQTAIRYVRDNPINAGLRDWKWVG